MSNQFIVLYNSLKSNGFSKEALRIKKIAQHFALESHKRNPLNIADEYIDSEENLLDMDDMLSESFEDEFALSGDDEIELDGAQRKPSIFNLPKEYKPSGKTNDISILDEFSENDSIGLGQFYDDEVVEYLEEGEEPISKNMPTDVIVGAEPPVRYSDDGFLDQITEEELENFLS